MSNNGTPENDSRRCDNSLSQTQPFSMEQISVYSEFYGAESLSISGEDRGTGNTGWKLVPIRDTSVGKIFERIESLEARHINYVRAHQSRLNARLDEALTEEQAFLEESNQIKSDLYHLAIAHQQNNGNGHKSG